MSSQGGGACSRFRDGSGLFLAAGCGGSDALKSPTAAKLKGLATMYLDYAAAKGSGPPSEAEFKKHLQRVEKFVLEDERRRSQSDRCHVHLGARQRAVRRLYGVGIGQISGNSAPVVAYEKTGVGGKRLVAFANTKLDHVDEARLKN